MSDCDLIIIGGGPGGTTAALEAERSGLKTVLVEKDKLGGVCLHRGCIPTKALLDGAKKIHTHRNFREAFFELQDRKEKTVAEIYASLEQVFARSKVRVIKGEAAFAGPRTVEIRGPKGVERLEAPAVLVSSGSRPAELPCAPFDGRLIHSSDTLLELRELPESIVIIGGGFIGVEFASLFSCLGVKVFLVEALERLLPLEDREIGLKLAMSFKKQGIEVLALEKLTAAQPAASGVECLFASGKTIQSHIVLVASGRAALLAGLGLEKAGIAVEKGRIVTNEYLQTSAEGIYAIGDVTDGPQLAHKAYSDARLAIGNLRGGTARKNYRFCPSAVYSHPEAASVGYTREQAEREGILVEEGKALFQASGRARVMQEPEGFVKLIAERTSGRLLGAQILGPNATELISGLALAAEKGMTLRDIAATVHPHPTLAESIQEAALQGVSKLKGP